MGYRKCNGVVTDSSDNIYITGYNPTSTVYDSANNKVVILILITVTLQWQKILGEIDGTTIAILVQACMYSDLHLVLTILQGNGDIQI